LSDGSCGGSYKQHDSSLKKGCTSMKSINIFRAKVVDVAHNYYTVEITGDEKKITAAINLFRPLGVKEIVRSGKAAISRTCDGQDLG